MAQRDPRWVDPLAAYHGTHDALSAQQLEQAKKVYHIFQGREISKMLRAMGLTPSYLDLRPLTSQAKETVSFQEFLDTYVMYTKAPDTHEALVAQLKSFDHQGDGTLDSDELMSALTTIGDSMTEAQVRQLISSIGETGRGRLKIDALAAYLLSP